jgi:hypothetical protein
MPEMEEKTLEERVQALETFVRLEQHNQLKMLARLRSLQQGLQEVCARLGISEEQALRRLQAAYEWHYGRLLETASDIVPYLAAHLDTREIDQVPTSEDSPRLLGEDRP